MNTSAFVESAKCKSDTLFETFKKELTVYHEEENTRANIITIVGAIDQKYRPLD